MDYSYFSSGPQAYQFLGLPPTPGHSGSAVSSEDFNHSPPVRAPSFHYMPASAPASTAAALLPHLWSQDFHLQTSNPAPYSLPHSHPSPPHTSSPLLYSPLPAAVSAAASPPPPPPPQYSPHHQTSPSLAQTQAFLTPRGQQDAFDQFQNFDAFNAAHYTTATPTANGLPKPPTPLSQHKGSISSNGHAHNSYDISSAALGAMDTNEDASRRGQSNSEDDDMTPAQSRRKAQNRAAQRAFRERKERHVKDLEAKLQALESSTQDMSKENDRLKRELHKAMTENEILKASDRHASRGASPPTTSGPLRYSPTDFYSEVLHAHENKFPSHRIVVSEGGERLLAAGAAWDYIIAHPLYLKGRVDVGDVSERLKNIAQCDGQGPVFEERAIIDAIEKSVASGSDELL